MVHRPAGAQFNPHFPPQVRPMFSGADSQAHRHTAPIPMSVTTSMPINLTSSSNPAFSQPPQVSLTNTTHVYQCIVIAGPAVLILYSVVSV